MDAQREKEAEAMASKEQDATAVWNMIKDLHLELIFMYHRVCLKLADIGPGKRYSSLTSYYGCNSTLLHQVDTLRYFTQIPVAVLKLTYFRSRCEEG